MPIVQGTYLTTRKANTAMSLAFFQRAKDWLFPRLCRSYITTSLHEPHAIGGASPPMRLWQGSMPSTGLPSWTLDIYNLIYKSMLEIRRTELEGDQTRTLIKKADEAGITLADHPELLMSNRILKGGLTSNTTVIQDGVTYTLTMDGLPQFATNHQLDGITSQSNEFTGGLPATAAALAANDVAQNAQIMQRDFQLLLSKIKTVKNNQGLPIWPTLNSKESIVVVVPSILEMAARLAFTVPGVIGGSPGNSGSTGSTTSIGPMFVKDLLVSGLLDGCPDVETSAVGATVSPAHPTSWYAFVVNDFVAPLYISLFKPAGPNDLFPPGYNVDAVMADALREAKAFGVTHDRIAATMFASSIVEHNLDKVGANAQRDVVENEKHFISPRWRGFVHWGPWFTSWRVDPSGTSGN